MKKNYYWSRPGLHSSDYGFSENHNHDRRTYAAADFFGKGPKGYKRKDTNIQEDVCEHLLWSPDVDASEIEVSVKEGIVYLKGFVDSRHAKKEAERVIDHLAGIQDIQNQLIIKRELDLSDDKIIARGDEGLFSQEIIQK
jgi:osmotically-inducible protein OsmY